jgi:tetratricopeptide (TPR) repeat protein
MAAAAIARGTRGPEEHFSGRLTELALGYQHMLEHDPLQPRAFVGLTLVALASRQINSAVKMAWAAVAAAPRAPVAWVALGQALKAAGRMGESERGYMQAIILDGTNALARFGLGELKLATERPEEAAREFELALKRQPSLAGAHLGLGNALALMGRNEEALGCFEDTLALRPHLPEAEFAAGFALARLGRLGEAETRYRRALVARPDFAAAWMNLGNLLREQGQDAWAEAALRRATQLRPDLVSGWINIAALERGRRRPEEAEKHLRKAFALNPSQVETHIAWCQFRLSEGDTAGARGWLRWALTRNPEQSEAVNMHGILLHTERRFVEAVEAFERAESLGHRAAVSNRGNSLLDLGRMDEALRAHALAVDLDPGHPGAQYNLALTQLRLGQWKAGWPGYESRWRFREVHRALRNFTEPRWRGEQLNGERVLLDAEQGLGDTIQFCRYVSLVAARGGVPVLRVQPATERLMSSLAVARAGVAEITVLGGEKPQFDLECPLMSLPTVFETCVDTVPWAGAYLGAEPQAVREKWMEFPSIRPGLRVGLAWQGNPKYKADRQRSMKLRTLSPLFRGAPVNWISLQKGEATGQLVDLQPDTPILDGSSRDRDLADAAALIATLDLVISTDTSIAHLAGAMGKPVWILLSRLSDWRWMEVTESTPWYPTARLFRQKSPGDWAEVIERVLGELSKM